MKQKRYTPAPWEIKAGSITSPNSTGKNGWVCSFFGESVPEREEAQANADLIATAPDMLMVLEEAGNFDWVCNAALTDDIEALRKICIQYSIWWNTRAVPVIEKATGQ